MRAPTPPFALSLSLSFSLSLHRYESHQDEVKIALVGKYTNFEDSYASVVKALKHACLQCKKRLNLTVWSAARPHPASKCHTHLLELINWFKIKQC